MARYTDREYKRRKKILNKYFKFSFKTPRNGKFNRGQKSAITRAWKEYSDLIERVNANKETKPAKFITGKSANDLVGVRTNKGIFVESSKRPKKNQLKIGKHYWKYSVRQYGDFIFFDFLYPYKNSRLTISEWCLMVDDAMKRRIKDRYMGSFYLRAMATTINPSNKFNALKLEQYLSESTEFKRAKIGSIVGITIASL